MKKLLGFLSGCCEERNRYKQFNLGNMYYNGQGVEQDYKQAVYWWQKSAEQGFATAQYNLGFMYAKGQGLEQDFVKAYMWFNISAYSGYPDAPIAKYNLSKLMTSEQIAEALLMAREWVEKFEKRQKE